MKILLTKIPSYGPFSLLKHVHLRQCGEKNQRASEGLLIEMAIRQ